MKGIVLLTGATGFVGRQILRALIENGAMVRVVVREGKQKLIPRTPAIESLVTTRDIFGERAVRLVEMCRGIDTLIHAAWYAEPGKYLQSPMNQDCLRGTLQLGKAAADAGIRRFVGVGTCAEYDLSKGTLSTDTPLLPQTPYAVAKAAAYEELSRLLPSRYVEFAWCRLFYLYGEREDPRRLGAYVNSRLADGKPVELTSGDQIRDFLDVRKAGEAIAKIGLGSQTGALNVCSGVPVSVREFAERIADKYGRRDLLRFGVRPAILTDPPIVVGVPSIVLKTDS